MTYDEFFRKAYGREADAGFRPYAYQRSLAMDAWPEVLDVPTGLGKTAAVTLAWIYRRQVLKQAAMPRRLVWCLPMRVLVEQTEETISGWLNRLGLLGEAGSGKVSVHVLMGGEPDLRSWAEYPEEDMVLIGTQDLLLSRALMRGYGMSRYQWPIHFALLHNDCQWVFDEVQLMGAGLATSAQLEAFRRNYPLAKGSRSLWVSATLNPSWLGTVDFTPHLAGLGRRGINQEDRQQAGGRLRSTKTVERLSLSFSKEAGNKAGLDSYIQRLADAIIALHDTHEQTLVILNRVDRAQQLFRRLRVARPGAQDLLVHSRFRAAERSQQNRRLRDGPTVDRIIVATQAVEAGVDLSSKLLITELAPWASLVQRFGRCNRYGEHNAAGARIFWVDIDDDADALPYETEALAAARRKLLDLTSASPEHLPPTDESRPLSMVLRRKDLLDLFNTDPDLSGFDVDVSDYIRDRETPGVQVFWRAFEEDPNDPEPQGAAERAELCPISMSQARDIHKRCAWYWDTLDERWARLERNPRPGMTLLLRGADGGYDEAIGFDAALKNRLVLAVAPRDPLRKDESVGGDPLTQNGEWISLPKHLADTAASASELCTRLAEDEIASAVIIRAARWHDIGKAHEVFQNALAQVGTPPNAEAIWAKSGGRGPLKYRSTINGESVIRAFFRHELASMLTWLAQHDGEPEADLIAYLIAAHHGKVRMSLRAMPAEEAPREVVRFARGVWEGDVIPAIDFAGEHSEFTKLRLALMEIGLGEQGPSWTERTLNLLAEHGPFRLAWYEAMVRLSDWRASASLGRPA